METGIMTSVQDALPPNILTAVRLVIEHDCSVMDAYRIVSDYPNIQHITVNMKSYTAQEIRQMPVHLGLGTESTYRVQDLTVNTPPRRFGDIDVADDYTAAENTFLNGPAEAIGNTVQAAQIGTVMEVYEHNPIPQGIYEQLINTHGTITANRATTNPGTVAGRDVQTLTLQELENLFGSGQLLPETQRMDD